MLNSFGNAKSELMPGARNAVETCLSIRAGEHVALIADEVSKPVAASLAAALHDCGANYSSFLLEGFGPRPMREAPTEVLQALETADVGIMCMTPQSGELGARMAIVKIVERRQIRYAHNGGCDAEIMQQGMRAELPHGGPASAIKLRERMLRAETLTVKTEAGTNIAAHFDPGLDWVKNERADQSTILVQPSGWRSVHDAGHGGWNFCLRCYRRRIIFQWQVRRPAIHAAGSGDQEGGLVHAKCARKDLEQEFWDYCHTDQNSDRVGELAFGTNLGLSRMIGVLLQDENSLASIWHLAIRTAARRMPTGRRKLTWMC